jgi:GT2 family glycosyltransferase
MNAPRKLVAIVTAYNRADFVPKCVASILHAEGDDLEVRVIVVDNGSTDGTAEAARAVSDRVRVLRTEDNRPVAEAINSGFAAARAEGGAEYIVYMNEDTMYTPGSLRRMIEACDENPNSLLTPLQLNYRAPEHLDDNMREHVAESRELVEDSLLGLPLKLVYPLPTIIGAAILAKRAIWERVGEFDTLFWFYGIDDDLCTRAAFLGCHLLLVPSAHMLHAHGKLGARNDTIDKAGIFRKWRLELQSRYLFLLKNPARLYPLAILDAVWLSVTTCAGCLASRWPKGALHAWVILGACLARLGRIAKTRRRHFDPARRLGG